MSCVNKATLIIFWFILSGLNFSSPVITLIFIKKFRNYMYVDKKWWWASETFLSSSKTTSTQVKTTREPWALTFTWVNKATQKEMYFFLSGRKIQKLLMFKDVWYKSEWFIRYKLFMCLGEQNYYPLPQTKKKSLIELYINPFKYWCKK